MGELPLLVKFFQDLWSREQYQFFPIALLAAGFVFWDRLRTLDKHATQRGSRAVAVALLGASWIVLCGGFVYLRWMAPVSTWLLLAAAVWWAGGRTLARRVLPAALLLLLIIPPPAHMDEAFANHLRVVAVRASSRVLDLVALPHLVSGTVIEIPGQRLLVQEACSGINSLMSVVAFTLLYGIWQRRRPWTVGVLFLAAAAFVLSANIARITLGAVLVHFWKIDILTGTGHELLGMVLFGASLGLVISFDRLIQSLVPEGDPARADKSPTPPPSLTNNSGGKTIWWLAAVAFAALGICLQARVGRAWPTARLSGGATFSLPHSLAGWEQVRGEGTLSGRPETDGRKSRFWVYRRGPLQAGVAMDYPFIGFHDATICYASSGWSILQRSELQPPGRPDEGFVQINMARAALLRGSLLFGLFDERGVAPPVPGASGPDEGRLRYALALSRQKANSAPTYQVQTLAIGYESLPPDQQASVRALFLAARAELSRQLVSQVGGDR